MENEASWEIKTNQFHQMKNLKNQKIQKIRKIKSLTLKEKQLKFLLMSKKLLKL